MASLTRSKAAPEVPTLNEAGLRDFQSTAWFALVAPPAMPAVLVDRINADIVAAMSDGDGPPGMSVGLEPLYETKWYVHAKRPFAGPEAVLAYRARYTHRVAISSSCLVAADENGVTFNFKDYKSSR